MEPIVYLFKVNLVIVIFCVVYRVFYRKDTFFTVRRYLLLSMLLLSAVYPLADFSHWMIYSSTLTDMALSYKEMMPEVMVYTSGTDVPTLATTTGSFVPFLFWFALFYILVTGVLLLRIVLRAIQICWLRIQRELVLIEGKRVYRFHTEISPFSFFSWIFINPDMHDKSELHEILAHEMVHVRQHHSIDMVFSEIMTAFCWMNPMAWMMKKEIRKNLEFIVDNYIVNVSDIDMKSYQYHLLKRACHPAKMTLANQFNISPLKERILMINGKRSPGIRLAAYTLILPLILLIFVFNNMDAVAARISHNDKMKNVVIKVFDMAPEQMVPDETNAMPSETDVVPSETDAMPGETDVVPSETDAMPGETDVVPSETNAMPGETDAMPSETDVMPSETDVVPSETQKPTQDSGDDSEDVIFVAVEKMPEFPGGDRALLQYIADNLNYPLLAAQNGIQGRVACRFVIREDGTVSNIEVIRPVDPSLDGEAVRILSSMPKWIPGEQRGKKVSVAYSIPILFRLLEADMAAL